MKPQAPPVPSQPLCPPTPLPAQGVVSWNMNTTCNYRCSYCTQRFVEDRGKWAEDTPRFLEAFGKLPGQWEIKLSGGEPFQHPTLLEVVQGLVSQGHILSVVTNFSLSDARLEAFLQAVRGRLRVLSVSLHLEYVKDIEAFVRRVAWARDQLQGGPAGVAEPPPGQSVGGAHQIAGTGGRGEAPGGGASRVEASQTVASSVCVTCVATRANLPQLERLQAAFQEAGLTFKVQPEKVDRDVVSYDPSSLALLKRLGGHNLTGELAWDFYGRPCWAGSRYFILDHRGEAYRCYPARRYRVESLGSFFSPDFALAVEPAVCRYHYCNCTVPISRGMMPVSSLPVAGSAEGDEDGIVSDSERSWPGQTSPGTAASRYHEGKE